MQMLARDVLHCLHLHGARREMSGLREDMKRSMQASQDGAALAAAMSADERARSALLRYVSHHSAYKHADMCACD